MSIAIQVRYVIGTMTGTSIDGIDVCLIQVNGEGLNMAVKMLSGFSAPFSETLKSQLRDLADQIPMTARQIAQLSYDFTTLHVETVTELIKKSNMTDAIKPTGIDLIAIHGQTVFHDPPLSWQLFSPTRVSHTFQVPVVYDMRAADLASGGQGAPITPLADWIIFRDPLGKESRAVVNLGGFCNVTIISCSGSNPSSTTTGGDVCACNHLLDTIARIRLGVGYDENGDCAMAGTSLPSVVSDLKSKLSIQASSKRSLGTADVPSEWLEKHAAVSNSDLCRSACAALASVIMESVSGVQGSIIIAGGGIKNIAIIEEMRLLRGDDIVSAHDFGIDPAYREAAEMAVLGALCQDRVPITIPAVTGVTQPVPIAGLWCFPTLLPMGKCPSLPFSAGTSSPPSIIDSSSSDTNAAATVTDRRTHRPIDRGHLLTEQRNPQSDRLHRLSIEECVGVIQSEDRQMLEAVEAAKPEIDSFISHAEAGFLAGGRLVYLGAGTSGRLGVLDASESPPTFQVDHGKVVGIIAGGDSALRRSSEGAEDDPAGAVDALVQLNLTSLDSVIGIAAGGTTPYVRGALDFLSKLPSEVRPVTCLITCTPLPAQPAGVDHVLTLAVGPEVITGSTRMKAGTATKLVLNTISTTLMVRLGKVYQNLMVDMRASNEKLKDRAARIVAELTKVDREASFELLAKAGGSCKTAVVMFHRKVGKEDADELLAAAGGRLEKCIE